MKKFFLILALSISLLFVFTGCNGDSNSISTDVTPEPTETGTYKYIDVKMCDTVSRTDGKGKVLNYSEDEEIIKEIFIEVNSGIARKSATKKQIEDTQKANKPGIKITCTDQTEVKVFTVYEGEKASKKWYLFEVNELGNTGYFVISSETMVDYLKIKNLDKVFSE